MRVYINGAFCVVDKDGQENSIPRSYVRVTDFSGVGNIGIIDSNTTSTYQDIFTNVFRQDGVTLWGNTSAEAMSNIEQDLQDTGAGSVAFSDVTGSARDNTDLDNELNTLDSDIVVVDAKADANASIISLVIIPELQRVFNDELPRKLEWTDIFPNKMSFNRGDFENQITANNGVMFCHESTLEGGQYNKVNIQTRPIPLGQGQQFFLRFALYTISGDLFTESFTILNGDDNGDREFQLFFPPFVLEENTQFVIVVGVNDNVGGGQVQLMKITANSWNNPAEIYTFQNNTGAMPLSIANVGISSVNHIPFVEFNQGII